MEDRKILVEVTKEELELIQNGFKKEEDYRTLESEQPANLIQRLLNKLDTLEPNETLCVSNFEHGELLMKRYHYPTVNINAFFGKEDDKLKAITIEMV